MKLAECLPTKTLHIETSERKAVNLLNHPTAFVPSATTQVTAEKEKTYLVAERSAQETYKITISARSLVNLVGTLVSDIPVLAVTLWL